MSTAAAFAALLEPSFLHLMASSIEQEIFHQNAFTLHKCWGKSSPSRLVGAQAQPGWSPVPLDIKPVGPVKGSEERDGR